MSKITAPSSQSVSSLPPEEPVSINFCTRATSTIRDILTRVWKAFQRCIAYITCGHFCDPYASLKNKFIQDYSATGLPECQRLKEAVDVLFTFSEPYGTTAVDIVKSQNGEYYCAVITTPNPTEAAKVVTVVYPRTKATIDFSEQSAWPALNDSQFAIRIGGTTQRSNWTSMQNLLPKR